MADEKKSTTGRDLLIGFLLGIVAMQLLGNHIAGGGQSDDELQANQRAFEQQQRQDLDSFNGTVNGKPYASGQKGMNE